MLTWLTVESKFVITICVTPSVPVPGPTDCAPVPDSCIRPKNGVAGIAWTVGTGFADVLETVTSALTAARTLWEVARVRTKLIPMMLSVRSAILPIRFISSSLWGYIYNLNCWLLPAVLSAGASRQRAGLAQLRDGNQMAGDIHVEREEAGRVAGIAAPDSQVVGVNLDGLRKIDLAGAWNSDWGWRRLEVVACRAASGQRGEKDDAGLNGAAVRLRDAVDGDKIDHQALARGNRNRHIVKAERKIGLEGSLGVHRLGGHGIGGGVGDRYQRTDCGPHLVGGGQGQNKAEAEDA